MTFLVFCNENLRIHYLQNASLIMVNNVPSHKPTHSHLTADTIDPKFFHEYFYQFTCWLTLTLIGRKVVGPDFYHLILTRPIRIILTRSIFIPNIGSPRSFDKSTSQLGLRPHAHLAIFLHSDLINVMTCMT